MKTLLITLATVCMVCKLASQDFKVMFYNVENFFDTRNDSLTDDDSFTPYGANHWTREKFNRKRNNIYKAMVSAGEGRMPEIIGVCEVENRYVLQQLTMYTPLAKYNYGIVHYDSPDRRGIDVALLYMRDSVNVVTSSLHTTDARTRGILYVKAETQRRDTLHFFVNHWASKWSGAASEDGRMQSARLLKTLTDSVFQTDPNANICIMGDFNDYPDSKPVKALGVRHPDSNVGNAYLYNLSIHLQDKHLGSIKFQNKWELIDLFFISGNLLFNSAGLHCAPDGSRIYRAPFLFETLVGEGESLYRTYSGPRYIGGFSDHLPILLPFTVGLHTNDAD